MAGEEMVTEWFLKISSGSVLQFCEPGKHYVVQR